MLSEFFTLDTKMKKAATVAALLFVKEDLEAVLRHFN
jgi:hypothetical protein